MSSLSTYVGDGGVSSTNKLYQMAIYTDNSGQPGTYVASTAVGTLNASAAWNTLPITATVSPHTTYWLVYWTNVNDGSNNGQDWTQAHRVNNNSQMWDTYENWQCSSGCGASTNGMPNTYPTSGNAEGSGSMVSIYATFANNLPGLQMDASGNTILNGTAIIQAQGPTANAFTVVGAQSNPALEVDTNTDTNFNSVGINCSPSGNYNLTVCAGGNGNGGGANVAGDSYQLFQVQNDGNNYLSVDSIDAQVSTADLTVGDPVNNLNAAGLLFSDNFESGNFSLWSGRSAGGEAVDSSQAHSGRYSAETNVASSTGYARTSFSSTSTTFTLNAWVKWHTLPVSGEIPLFTLYQASSPTNKVQLYLDQNGYLGIINGTTDLGTQNAYITNDTWSNIALTINRTTGEITIEQGLGYMYVGAAANDYTGLTIGSGWDILDMGVTSSNTGQYWIDDLAFGTGLTPSLANGLMVQDSLHTGGSATFGGQVLVQPGSNSATALQVQDASSNNLFSVDTAGDHINVGATGTTALATTTNIGTSTGAAQTVNIGSDTGAGATTLQSGTGNVNVLSTGNITLGQTVTASGTILGFNGVGSFGNGCNSSNCISGSNYTTTGGGTLGSMSVYYTAPNSGDHFQFAIYTDNSGVPGSYVASSAVGTLTSVAGWYTLPITATLAPSTTYWITYADNGTDGINYNPGVSSASACNTTFAFGTGPDNGLPNQLPQEAAAAFQTRKRAFTPRSAAAPSQP